MNTKAGFRIRRIRKFLSLHLLTDMDPADPALDPAMDPALDPALFVSGFQDANKKQV
jgi:hypothetical protein